MTGAKKTIPRVPKWQYAVGVLTALASLYATVLVYSALVRPDTKPRVLPYSEQEVAAVRRSRAIPETLPELPRATLEVADAAYARAAAWASSNAAATPADVAAAVQDGRLPAWYPRGEAPVLAGLAGRGDLPPVAERVGPEPVVLRGCDGLGTYGGTWLRVANSQNDMNVITWRLGCPRLFRFGPMGFPIVPHVAKSCDVKDGGRVWDVTLRRIRWSDGHPVTADDVLYWWNHEQLDKSVGAGTPPAFMLAGGEYGTVEKVGEQTVRFRFPKPYGSFLEVLATYDIVQPGHYLRRYHPALGDPAFLEREQAAYALASTRQLYYQMKSFLNPELPNLQPWIYRTSKTLPPQVFVRNPYYYAVDEEGKQLPYIDRVQFEIMDNKMLAIAAANGQISMQNRFIRFENYTELASRTKAAGTRLLHWVPGTRSDWIIHPNQNRLVLPGKPDTAWKAALLADKRFRQAMSLAINRTNVIDAMFFGLTRPVQVEPGPLSPYHSPRLASAFTAFDPERASRLLDEVWRERGADPGRRVGGFRCTPEGELLTFYLDFSEFTGMGPAQFVVDDWARVGIRCSYRQRTRTLFYTEKAARNFDFNVWSSESEFVPLSSPRCFIAAYEESNFAVGWGAWYARGGLYGTEASRRKGNIPVPPESPMYRAMLAFEEARQTVSEDTRRARLAEVFDIAAENLWVINVCGAPPALVICSADMRNVPDKAIVGAAFSTPGNTAVETYYFEHPDQAAAKDTVEQVARVVPMPRPGAALTPRLRASRTLQWLMAGVAALFVALLCFRHPFVLRRLFIMVPTLLVISACVFSIVQLPPGDFLSARIMQLQESGADEVQIRQQTSELRTMFHFDEPAVTRYLRWMGVHWFGTFADADRGLLQGNMGRSMETGKSVNDMVGDRILLTVLVSLGTVLFTWALAFPIGFYSAVRQYSVGDYVFTFLGFLGMCVPSFLLALILMALTNVSGLFSAKFAVQPYWSWGKVADLLTHIWIPVAVMGIGGTAGMIRVMRANLLDELRKPYVTTARAKGLRPFRLLLKYPVRLALNPFISGIGGLFPHLVSGSSIVAIVMSLPMVGPLMLTALFSQDMNMAGSMLMVLSLLGVLGTLVSDLLLLALDPRIRIGGGGA